MVLAVQDFIEAVFRYFGGFDLFFVSGDLPLRDQFLKLRDKMGVEVLGQIIRPVPMRPIRARSLRLRAWRACLMMPQFEPGKVDCVGELDRF